MDDTQAPLPARRDGWTLQRRRRFIEALGAGIDVRRACAAVGMSREGAYRLRRRDPAFARVWDEALRSARDEATQAWLAMLPDRLRRAMSELPGECDSALMESRPGQCQRCQGSVTFGPAEFPPRTVSELSGKCELRTGGIPAQDSVRVVRQV